MQKYINVLLKLLSDKRFVTATITTIVAIITTTIPSVAQYEPFIMVGLFALAAVTIHGFTLSEVQGAGNAPPVTLTDALIQEFEALVAALNSNTNTTATNTTVIASTVVDKKVNG